MAAVTVTETAVMKIGSKLKEKRIMRKELFLSVALLGAVATLVSCQKTQNEISEVYSLSVEASKAAVTDSQTKALVLDGSAIIAVWSTSENVYVKKGESWATGSLQPQAVGTSSTLKGTLSGVTLAENDAITLQFPKSGDITYSGQQGTLEDIAANFDWATANATIASVEEGKITVSDAVTFTNQQAIVKFTLKNGEAALSVTKLVVKVGATEYEVSPASATGVIYVAIPGCSGKSLTLTAIGSDSKTYRYDKAGVTFENGKYYTRTVKMSGDALPGLFSVSASQKVKFAKGNLQATYDGTDWTWKFAENQWGYIGNAAGNTKVTATSPFISEHATVDLFGWVGASSTWTGAAMYGITSSNSTKKTDGYGNVDTEAMKHDWGELMGAGVWRTLNKDEWDYLFNTRTVNGGTGSGKTYTNGKTVNGVYGLVLYPDDYTGSEYTGSDWSTFETAGCVFLPAAGSRGIATVNYAGGTGFYWSSTPVRYNADSAYRLTFKNNSGPVVSNNTRLYGLSVRLVQNQ